MNKDVIFFPQTDIMKARKKFETPFFLYEENRIRENCQTFRDSFVKYFPDFAPLYAVKANSNPEILNIIADEGFEMDSSSEAEVWISEKIGLKGMFTGNYTTAETLKFAHDRDFILNLDDISMIPFLKKIGVPEMLSFRINPGVGKGGSGAENVILAGPDAKYGIPFEKAAEAYAMAAKMGVKKFGIHMMTGSNILDENYFAEIVEKLFEIVANVKKVSGVEISLMNIGGGFGVPYRPEEKSLNLDKLAANVRRVFDKQCKKYNLKEPQLMAEPGRYIMADAGWLVSTVTVIKDSYKKFIGIDASSNDMPRPSIYGAYHHVSVVNDAPRKEVVSVVGTICENVDQFARDRKLPVCEVGDTVIIHNCGAHAYSMGHNYNGKLRHAEYLVGLDGVIRRIRRAETFEDLYGTTDGRQF